MDEKRIYKSCLLLPVVVLLIGVAFRSFRLDLLPEFVAQMVETTIFLGVFGAIPYAVLAISMFVWISRADRQRIRTALLFSPLLMIGLFLIFGFVYILVSGDYSRAAITLSGVIYTIIIFSGLTLLYGYFYVLLTFVLVKIFGKKPLENLPE